MTKFEALFETFKEGKILVFTDPNYLRGFLDFLPTKNYKPTPYVIECVNYLREGLECHVGIRIIETTKEAWGVEVDDVIFDEIEKYYADIEDVDVMRLLTQ